MGRIKFYSSHCKCQHSVVLKCGAIVADVVDSEASTLTHVMAEQLPEGFFDDPKMDAKVSCESNSYMLLLLLLHSSTHCIVVLVVICFIG